MTLTFEQRDIKRFKKKKTPLFYFVYKIYLIFEMKNIKTSKS